MLGSWMFMGQGDDPLSLELVTNTNRRQFSLSRRKFASPGRDICLSVHARRTVIGLACVHRNGS